jgi:hypothetical protein
MMIKKTTKTFEFTTEQKEILFGVILGDAHLDSRDNGLTYRLKFSQSAAHKNYLFHLYDIFKDFVTTPPKFRADTSC